MSALMLQKQHYRTPSALSLWLQRLHSPEGEWSGPIRATKPPRQQGGEALPVKNRQKKLPDIEEIARALAQRDDDSDSSSGERNPGMWVPPDGYRPQYGAGSVPSEPSSEPTGRTPQKRQRRVVKRPPSKTKSIPAKPKIWFGVDESYSSILEKQISEASTRIEALWSRRNTARWAKRPDLYNLILWLQSGWKTILTLALTRVKFSNKRLLNRAVKEQYLSYLRRGTYRPIYRYLVDRVTPKEGKSLSARRSTPYSPEFIRSQDNERLNSLVWGINTLCRGNLRSFLKLFRNYRKPPDKPLTK